MRKTNLIIIFVFIVLLGSSLIVQIVRIDLPVVIFIKVKHGDEGLFIDRRRFLNIAFDFSA